MSAWPEFEEYQRLVGPDWEVSPPTSLEDVVDDVLPHGQHEVGRRWEINEMTVAEEHAATEAARKLLRSAAERYISSTGRSQKVLVTCADGEWHGLAAHSLATALAGHGHRTMVAPPSTHSAQLPSLVHDNGFHAIAVTCSMPANLPGARRMIVAALDTGTPVLVGGRAFGSDESRARMLSATAWAPNVGSAHELTSSFRLSDVSIQPLEHELEAEFTFVEATRPQIVGCLGERLVDGSLGDHRVVNAAAWMGRSLLSSLMCNDPTIFEDQVSWQARRAEVAGAPHPEPILLALLECLPPDVAVAHAWVAERLESSIGAQASGD